jgi:PAS domain S-box-containing protein
VSAAGAADASDSVWPVPRLLLARVVVFAWTAAVGLAGGAPAGAVLAVLGALALLTAGAFVAERAGLPRRTHLLLQFVFDVLLVSVLAWVTGGSASPYAILYALVSVTGGLWLGVSGGLLVSVMASAAYAAVALGDFPQTAPGVFRGVPGLCIHSGSFITAAVLGGLLGERFTMRSQALTRAKLELNRARLEADFIIRNISGGVLTIDGAGAVVYMNPMAERILDCRLDEARGRPVEEALAGGRAPFAARLRESLARGRSAQRDELAITRDGGGTVPIGASISVLGAPAGEQIGAIALFQDLTEAKVQEAAAHQRERLAAIGELAAGIAHEMRNCLKPLGGSVDLLRKELVVTGENAHLMDLVVRQTQTLEGFVRDLLSYAREHPLAKSPADLRVLLREALAAVRRHPAKTAGLTIVERFPEAPVVVRVDADAIRQVVTNLAINGLEAMSSGALTITVEAPAGPPAEPGRAAAAPAVFARVDFTDEGCGIPPGQMEQVLKPFFTTKRGGSGLGLPIAHRIVERHGGRLSLASRPGQGTTVSIYLPWEP